MADHDDDILADAREAYAAAAEAWAENHAEGLDDLRFARLGEQWPEAIAQQRDREGRPRLTINKLPAFIRQVVNDARQNKPAIKVRPADSTADPHTAEVFNGLIRNIEYSSNADVAYDSAVESAVTNGFGYFRIGLDYGFADSFDLDVTIERISNPFSVLPDPQSTAADSADWNSAFVIDSLDRKAFERQYKGAEAVDWDGAYAGLAQPWLEEGRVLVAEWWTREAYDRPIVELDDGTVLGEDQIAASAELQAALAGGAARIMRRRVAKSWRVKQRLLTGAEVISERDWPGRFIPIVPVWGDEVDVLGRRHFRSLIRDAKDPQRMYNYWRTTATELVALAPRVPFIGPEGFADADPEKWAVINQASIPYVQFTVNPGAPNGGMPMRQPTETGPAAGALQEALNANDDIKSTTGLYDASLGARSNETSGRAILARQREGDVSTFHFIDNLARAIRHAGRILIDLVPHVYSGPRIVRVIGEDGAAATVAVGPGGAAMPPGMAAALGAQGGGGAGMAPQPGTALGAQAQGSGGGGFGGPGMPQGGGAQGLGLAMGSLGGAGLSANMGSPMLGQANNGNIGSSMSGQGVNPAIGSPGGAGLPANMGSPMLGQANNQLLRMHDLSAGKYDLTVTTGPSFTTRREEAAAQMTELLRAFPPAAAIVGPELAKNLDWPGADRIAQKLEALSPHPATVPPQIQAALLQGQQALQQQAAALQQLKAENAALKADRSLDAARLQLEQGKLAVEQQKAEAARVEAETRRAVALRGA